MGDTKRRPMGELERHSGLRFSYKGARVVNRSFTPD